MEIELHASVGQPLIPISMQCKMLNAKKIRVTKYLEVLQLFTVNGTLLNITRPASSITRPASSITRAESKCYTAYKQA